MNTSLIVLKVLNGFFKDVLDSIKQPINFLDMKMIGLLSKRVTQLIKEIIGGV